MDPDYAHQTDAEALAAMAALLPEKRELVAVAFAKYAAFREICHDYLACRRSLARAGNGSGPLVTQLEQDLAEEASLWIRVIEAQGMEGEA
jgi:hypothetical protein